MKKILYLFIAIVSITSCESNEEINSDPIIGTWQLQSVLENGTEQATDCEKKTTIVFLENGTTTNESFNDDGNNGCESNTDSSTWVNIGNSTYRIDSDDEDVKLNFSQNNTVFTASISESYNGMTFTTVITYKKI